MAFGGNPVFGSKNTKAQFSGNPAGAAGAATLGATDAMSAQQLQDIYNSPSATPAETNRMTYDDVIMKTLLSIGVVILGALVPLFVVPQYAGPLMWIGVIGGLVLGLVNSFKREPVPALILAYSFLEGLFLGAITLVLDTRFPGVGIQAVVGTLCVFVVALLLFRSGKVRATPKAMKFFMIAVAGYALFSLVNLFMMLFGVTNSMFGMRSGWIGVVIGLIAIGLAAFSLIVDFTMIEAGVKNGAPARYSWTGAFGLTVTLVWLYVEILRLLAILQSND